ncbi:LacI family transcriptional regulator [Alkalihalobacillus oceani]|uniref:LacI family transcriptional regulator n=1 Tax=Halalkalibacter oceani TaxID=1653776 RepID=A0A9X2DUH8_9BACI|nr:LacI family DNA-binding transcriptional regulator [Halalkalibacter oceani]MCM3716310.1 LacI family transcriptional regulator [Halalkalibacter oceani]
MATIKDVAKLAGVAVSTASNALNGKNGVSIKTRKRVIEIATKLNYVPNTVAQGLVTKMTKNVSIVLSAPSSFNIFSNPIFFDSIKSITATLNKNGYHALLNIVSLEDEESVIPKIAQSRIVDAMIYIGTRRKDRELEQLIEKIEIPVIVLIRSAVNERTYSVSLNNKNCGYIATRYLLEKGHEKIGFIGKMPGISMAEERLEGYKQALLEAGVAYDETLVISGDYYQESGLIGVRRLLREYAHAPTAVFAANDLMALGAIEGLEQEGILIPNDISIVGCDNIPNLHLLKVPLTTISNPFAEVGRLGANMIIDILRGIDIKQRQITLNSEIRVRKSVRKIK